MAERPYSRVYWSVMDDEKFDGIREDMRLLGAWTLLLVVADMAWPSAAFIPPTVSKPAIDALVKAGLVEVLGAYRFRVHGLDREREMRAQWGRDGAALRWQGDRNGHPMQAKPSIDKQSKANVVARARARLVPDDEPIGPDEEKAVTAELIARQQGVKR